MKITKKQFEKAQKYLKSKFPYLEFELSSENRIYQPNKYGSDTDFVEISVDSLFEIILDKNSD